MIQFTRYNALVYKSDQFLYSDTIETKGTRMTNVPYIEHTKLKI